MMITAQRKEEEKIAKQRERDREQGMAYQRKEAEKSAAESALRPTAASRPKAAAPRKAAPARRRR